MKILADTSVFIDYTRANKGVLLQILDLRKRDKAELFIPTIVIAELWAGKSMEDREEKKLVKELISGFGKVNLSVENAKRAGVLMRKNQVPGAFDAIVAATAIEIDAELATQNKKHFEKVRGLKLFELHKS